jgi:TetR/AcrR family transcriptional repressor of nem operon
LDTAERIIKTAEALILERGFSGFSFQDVAERVGIRKASIHYHFATKAALGRAVIADYRVRMKQAWAALEGGEIDHWQAFALYVQPMIVLGQNAGEACTCGVLGGEYLALPAEMRAEVEAYFGEHEDWLTAFLEDGRTAEAFHFSGEARAMARLIFSAVEGALLIKRVKNDDAYFDGIVASISEILK